MYHIKGSHTKNNSKHNSTIKETISSYLVRNTAISMIIMTIFFIAYLFFNNLGLIFNKQQIKSKSITNEVNYYLTDIKRFVNLIGRIDEFIEFDTESMISLIKSIPKHNSSFEYLAVIDNMSNIKYDYQTQDIDFRKFVFKFISEIYRTTNVIQTEYISPVIKRDGSNYIILASPLRDKKGIINSSFISIINLKYLGFILNKNNQDSNTLITLIDSYGNPLIGESKSDGAYRELILGSYPNSFLEYKNVSIHRGIDSSLVIGTSEVIYQTGWKVFTEEPIISALSPILSPTVVAFFIIILTGIFITMSLNSVLKIITKPIDDLTNLVDTVRAGNYTKKLKPQYHDEFNKFVDIVNEMIDSIRDRELKIVDKSNTLESLNEELNQTLEELVETNEEIQRVNQQLQITVQEREMLIKEVHHRVKNNLQIILSLINLQENNIPIEFRVSFKDLKSRVLTMSSIHRRLYQSKDIATVDISEFLKGFITDIKEVYGAESRGVVFSLHLKPVHLSIDRSVPICLVINEVITNIFKYAFNQPKALSEDNHIQNTITINLSQHDDDEIVSTKSRHTSQQICLSISDNGSGFDIDKGSDSLGIKLILSLIEQVSGRYEFSNENGTRWDFYFNET